MKPKSFIFIVQGEGRGHLTQAIALYALLKNQNMELCCVIVGCFDGREISPFFQTAVPVPIVKIPSPGFVKDKQKKGVRQLRTIIKNISHLPSYIKSLQIIHKLLQFHKPDIIVNFYEPVATIYTLLYRPSIKIIAIAHQFIYLHPDFQFPGKKIYKSKLLKIYSRFIAAGADKVLALSMYPLENNSRLNLRVIPPLLRSNITQAATKQESFILAYLVHSGYIDEIVQWHVDNPNQMIHCFTDSEFVKKEKQGLWQFDDTLYFHSLNDVLFMELMACCKGLVTSAGFESVCEALFLEKPVMMVPVAGHYEQYCNAVDAQKTGAGIHTNDFNITRLLNYLPFHHHQSDPYRLWVGGVRYHILKSIRELYPHEHSLTRVNDDLPILKIV